MNGVLITAGGNGIGWAMGQAFAAAGFRVWVTDVEAASLDACPAEWQKSLVDASDETQVADLFAEIHKTWGRLEAICANAGIAGPTAAVEEIDLSDWQRCVSVNLEGAFLAAKYGGPMLKVGAWCHGVDLLYRWTIRLPQSGALCGGEMGHHRLDEDPCDGMGA